MTKTFTALMIGNSRYHWANIVDGKIKKVWHCSHAEPLPKLENSLIFAAVVPTQRDRLKQYFPNAHEITLSDIPLKNLYPTLGIDRALAMYGAGETYGYPCLVIDGGTALTFSGVDGDRHFVGGAILPGLRLQFQMLAQSTAALPKIDLPEQLPTRWAQDTKGAIASGIVHTMNAGTQKFIRNWLTRFPASPVIFTGGDGKFLLKLAQKSFEDFYYDKQLINRALQVLFMNA